LEVWIIQTLFEVLAGETPGEWFVQCGVALTEGVDSGGELVKSGAVVRGEHLALDDRKVDLDLIEPTCVHGCMHDDDAWVTVPQFVGGALATMRRAVVHDPEHASRRTVRFLIHDLIDQASECRLACVRFTAAEDLSAMDIPRGQILQRSAALVFVLDTGRLERTRRQRWMASTTDLDAGLLIGAEHVLIRPEWLTLPGAGVQGPIPTFMT